MNSEFTGIEIAQIEKERDSLKPEYRRSRGSPWCLRFGVFNKQSEESIHRGTSAVLMLINSEISGKPIIDSGYFFAAQSAS
jgi:hypothetical protein